MSRTVLLTLFADADAYLATYTRMFHGGYTTVTVIRQKSTSFGARRINHFKPRCSRENIDTMRWELKLHLTPPWG